MLIPARTFGASVVPISVATINMLPTARQAAILICGVQNRGLTDSGDQRLIPPITYGAAAVAMSVLRETISLIWLAASGPASLMPAIVSNGLPTMALI